MANATATLKVYPFPQGIDNTQRRIHVNGPLAISASPATYPTGGLPLSWTTMVDSVTGQAILLDTTKAPFMVWIQSVAGSGYVYGWNASTGNVQIFTTGTATEDPLNELTNGATIPAAVSGDTITFEAEFVRATQ